MEPSKVNEIENNINVLPVIDSVDNLLTDSLDELSSGQEEGEGNE